MRSFRAKVAAVAALVLVLTPTAGLSQQSAGKLSITVSGARNSDGVVRCALFNSPATFPKIGREWPGVIARSAAARRTACSPAFRQELTPWHSFMPSIMAFFHAEHNETQLTTGMFGKPLQGYGFSNNATGSFGPPNFSAAAFRYDGGNMGVQLANRCTGRGRGRRF